ncbi:MAG: hypothetical protein M3X11_06425 [Acidobacteriota bacterium]|nr:hypothetical protein [Acidobacteriota bacterium]
MLRRKNNISLQSKLTALTAAVMLCGVTALAVHRGVLSSHRAAPQERQPVVTAVPLPGIVPTGVPVALSNPTATVESDGSSKSQRVSAISFQALPLSAEKLTSLNLLVLEFDERGLLRRVDGFLKRFDLSAAKAELVTLPIDRRVRNGYRLAVAVERADSAAQRWEADFNELARGVATVIAGSSVSGVAARSDAALSPDTGAALCAGGMRRATALAQAGDKSGLAGYTCNQSEGSFTISFNGKVLF